MRALEDLAEIFHQTSAAGVVHPPQRVEKYKKNEETMSFHGIPLPKVPIINHPRSELLKVSKTNTMQTLRTSNDLLIMKVDTTNYVILMDKNTDITSAQEMKNHTFSPTL